MLGAMMLPPVSLPIEKPTKPAAVEPDVVERQRSHAQLGEQHRARRVQSRNDRGIRRRHAVAERFGAVGRGNAGCVEQILAAPRHAMQRTAVPSRRDLGVSLLRLLQRVIARERDDRADFWIQPLDSVEIDARQLLG
jgi:hypothetical protein